MHPSERDIQRVTEMLVREFRPSSVVLFGSRAQGSARPDSDVDLLVVLPFEGSPIAKMSEMLARAYQVMETPFAVEFHPRRPLAEGALPDPVMDDALKKGVVLYEAAA